MHLTKLTYKTPSGKPHNLAEEQGQYLTDQEELKCHIKNKKDELELSSVRKDPWLEATKRAELNELLKKVKND